MGHSHVVLGDLTFGSATDFEAWRTTPLDGGQDDTPAPWSGACTGTNDEALDRFIGDCTLIERGEATVKLRPVVDNDSDAFADGRIALVRAFRKAAPHAHGSLVIVGYHDAPDVSGIRVSSDPAGSSFTELTPAEVQAVEASTPYAEAEELVASAIGADDPFFTEASARLAKEQVAGAAVIASAPDMKRALALLPEALPKLGTFWEKDGLEDHPVVAALVARKDANASEAMRARLAAIVGGPLAGQGSYRLGLEGSDLVVAGALAHALWNREQTPDVVRLWIESPHFFLRDHERVRSLERPDLDAQLAALLGKHADAAQSDNHRWIVEALFASDPGGAPARSAALLEGDPRSSASVLESLRWIVSTLESETALDSAAWRSFVRGVITSQPMSSSSRDVYDGLRDDALGVAAAWKMPEVLPFVREHFESIGVERAATLLESLGDPAGAELLVAALPSVKKKAVRAGVERAIQALGGSAKPSPAAKKKAAKPKKA